MVEEALTKKRCTGLELRDDRLARNGIWFIAEALRCNTTLIKLDLRTNDLTDPSITLLMNVLTVARTNLKSLNLSDNRIGETAATSVGKMLETNDKLTHLWLETNQINDQGVEAIATALQKSNRTLEQLYLSGNELITDRRVTGLIRMLDENRALTQLELSDCSLSPNGRWQLDCIEKRGKFQLIANCSLSERKSYPFGFLFEKKHSSWVE